VYDNSLLLLNTTVTGAVLITLTATVGIILLAAGAIGHILIPATLYERAFFIAGSLCLIIPGLITDTAGLSLGAIGIGSQLLRRRRIARAGTAPAGVT